MELLYAVYTVSYIAEAIKLIVVDRKKQYFHEEYHWGLHILNASFTNKYYIMGRIRMQVQVNQLHWNTAKTYSRWDTSSRSQTKAKLKSGNETEWGQTKGLYFKV